MVFGGFGLMGMWGKIFFDFNFKLFGILAYLYPLGTIYLGYLFYKEKKFTLRLFEVFIASIFLLMLLLILQSLLFGIGIFGIAVISYLQPFLGIFGIWILSLLGIGACLLSFGDQDIAQIIKKVNSSNRFKQLQSHFVLFLKMLFSKISSFIQKIPLFLIQRLTLIKAKLTPQITHSPLIEIPESTQVDLQNLLPQSQEENQNPSNIPILQIPKQPEEEIMFKNDEKINIQEFIIATKNQEKKSHIRIVDELKPQKENPFSNDRFPLNTAQEISTSMELLKKIKNQDLTSTHKQSQSQITQTDTSSNPHDPTSFAETQTSLEQSLVDDLVQNPSPDLPHFEKNLSIEDSDVSQAHHPIDQDPKIQSLGAMQDAKSMVEFPSQESQTTITSSRSPHHQSSIKAKTTHIKSLEENEALLKEIDQGDVVIPKDYKLPPISLLSPAPAQENEIDESEIDLKIQSLLTKLAVFKIEGDVIRTYSGPIITTLEFRPAPNVKVSRIQSLENDIAMALEAKSIRIQAPIPGKNVVGIEIPNSTTQTIYLREIFESEIFQNSASPLTLALGKDVVGNPFITDLKKLPHLLIAGTTGSGKSVGVNAMILSLLYRNSPDDLKLMMVDPKMVEFMPYSDLPHLITPIITDPKKAVIGLANAVKEMERRYTLMSQSRTKEIVSYNQKAEELGLEKFPYFVIIIDELADLMMTAGREVEYSMARIAQMGRASGIHLIVATQSPRAEVLTGLIKTNLPAHLSYKVGTKIDAGIIGCAGAETLLGRGDMLFTPPGVSGLVRLHAPWSSEDEVNEIIAFIKEQREVIYDPQFLPEEREALGAMDCELDEEMASLVNKAHQIILQDGKTSISYLQRRLSIGYNKAATIVEKLGEMGILSEPDAKGNRQIL